MAVAGLPEPQADHTLRVARFAMDAVKAAQAVPVDPVRTQFLLLILARLSYPASLRK